MSVIISGKYHNDDKRTKPHRKIVFFLVLSVFGLRVAGNLTFCDITILITLLFILLKGYKFSVSELIVPLVFVFYLLLVSYLLQEVIWSSMSKIFYK